ncbi:MAG: FAD-dependent oxidoreductase, partial [Eggerthellaceae bacterium]|nr:FAD-dependent oxidoreductase [Eggerthellaceae bacterium]
YVAIGAQGGKMLDLPGADAEGVMSAVDLLTRIGDGDYPDFTGKRVVAIGGGNVAMDCARTSVRAGAASVQVASRRRVDDMTALRTEIDSAMQEGVEILMLQSPERIEVDENGRCAALVTQPQFIGAVKRGRPAPQRADKPPLRIPADVVLVAVGQAVESAPFEEAGMAAERSRFVASPELKAAGSLPNVFVGGDCQLGPKTVILAVGAGRVAARNIDEFLGYHHKLDIDVEAPDARPNDRRAYGRVEVHERLPHERRCDFEGVEVEMSVEEARQEASRCLRCDHYGCGAMEGGRIQYV